MIRRRSGVTLARRETVRRLLVALGCVTGMSSLVKPAADVHVSSTAKNKWLEWQNHVCLHEYNQSSYNTKLFIWSKGSNSFYTGDHYIIMDKGSFPALKRSPKPVLNQKIQDVLKMTLKVSI